MDNGKPFKDAFNVDLGMTIKVFRFYAGFADKDNGDTIPVGKLNHYHRWMGGWMDGWMGRVGGWVGRSLFIKVSPSIHHRNMNDITENISHSQRIMREYYVKLFYHKICFNCKLSMSQISC